MKQKLGSFDIDETLMAFLGLKYHLVGVKVHRNDGSPFPKPDKPMAFCHMVRQAAYHGKTFTFDQGSQSCMPAEFILGFREPKYTYIKNRVKPAETNTVSVAPLTAFKDVPDTILVILTPKQVMVLAAIMQAGKDDFFQVNFRGEQACGEFFAMPYMTHRPNLSFLCSGSRVVYSDYRENEVIIGAPPEIYEDIAKKIVEITKTGGALCGCRTSDVPKELVEAFEKAGFSKGIDYFFSTVDGLQVRVLLNKDFHGSYGLMTVYFILKMSSEKEASETAEKLRRLLRAPYSVRDRGPWLDLYLTATSEEMSIDIYSPESIRSAINEIAGKVQNYLNIIKAKSVGS